MTGWPGFGAASVGQQPAQAGLVIVAEGFSPPAYLVRL